MLPRGIAMTFTRFNDFGELYRAAFAEPDEQKKSALLREVERIIRNTPADTPREASYAVAKAA